MKVVIKYDNKPPYLPVAVAETRQELANLLGISRNVVDSSFSHHRSTYYEYEFDETMEDLIRDQHEVMRGQHDKEGQGDIGLYKTIYGG